jgi:hypothetical protein
MDAWRSKAHVFLLKNEVTKRVCKKKSIKTQKKGYYRNKKRENENLTKKRNLINLNTRECSKNKFNIWILEKTEKINMLEKISNKIINGEFDPGSG